MQTFQTLLYASLLALTFSSVVQAQDAPPVQHRNEIAIDASPILLRNGHNPLPGIMYRRHYSKGALRTRLNASGNDSFQTTNSSNNGNSGTPRESPANSINLQASIGYQWNHSFNKLHWYVGVDAGFAYSNYRNEIISIQNNTSNSYTFSCVNSGNSRTYSLNPFIGLRYSFLNRLSLSLETSISAYMGNYYSDQQITDKVVDFTSDTVSENVSASDNKGNSKGYSFNPVSAFLLSYHF